MPYWFFQSSADIFHSAPLKVKLGSFCLIKMRVRLSYHNQTYKLYINLKRGKRVSLSPIEIEQVIKKYPKIVDAACNVLFDSNEQTEQLVAYQACQGPSKETAQALHQLLSLHLSDYKIPS